MQEYNCWQGHNCWQLLKNSVNGYIKQLEIRDITKVTFKPKCFAWWVKLLADDILIFFSYFSGKKDFTHHANYLLGRQFAWSVRSYFLWKIRKHISSLSSAKSAKENKTLQDWFSLWKSNFLWKIKRIILSSAAVVVCALKVKMLPYCGQWPIPRQEQWVIISRVKKRMPILALLFDVFSIG